MKLKNSLLAAFGITVLVSLGAFFMIEREKSIEHALKKAKSDRIQSALTQSSLLLNKNHPLRALSILEEVENEALADPLFQELYVKLTVQAANELGDTPLLEALLSKRPDLVLLDDEVHLKLAEAALSKGDFEQFEQLGKGESGKWQLLYADKLAMQDKATEALDGLKKVNFDEKESEIQRLLRLALLNQNEHPGVAWGYLTSALKLDPQSSELHFYRGVFLEHSQQEKLAIEEYKEAIKLDPSHPFYKETLVDFYLKKGSLEEAYLLLSDSIIPPSSDQLWLQALFINQIYKKIAYDFKAASPPNGELTPLIRYLLAIPSGHFWSDSLLSSQTNVKALVGNFKESPWLEVLEQMQDKRLQAALSTLEKHPEMEAINPALYQGLLRGKESYLALLLKAGWNEAAILISQSSPLPSDTKMTVLYPLIKAIEKNQGLDAAIQFASDQRQTAEMKYLIGDLYLKNGNQDEAIKALTPISKISSEIGSRSALILANLYYKLEKYPLAKETIEANELLANSVKGKEFLAKIALKMNDPVSAEKIYTTIAPDSFEAVSYFAAKAYQSADYKLAYKLTKQLIDKYPTHTELKANLQQILAKLKSEPAAKALPESPLKSDLGAGSAPHPKGSAPVNR